MALVEVGEGLRLPTPGPAVEGTRQPLAQLDGHLSYAGVSLRPFHPDEVGAVAERIDVGESSPRG